MAATDTLLKPEECVMLLVDFSGWAGIRCGIRVTAGPAQQRSRVGA